MIFRILLIITSFCVIFAEFIANEDPIFIIYNKSFYFPFFKYYSEEEFGEKIKKPIDFYNSELGKNVLKNSTFVINPIMKIGPNTVDFTKSAPYPPTKDHIFGTDDHGRDVFVRILYGTRISGIFGIVLTFISLIIALIIGGIQGYFGGIADIIIGRIIEIWASIPSLFVILIITTFFQTSLFMLMFIILMFNWVTLSSVIRVEFLKTKKLDYINAAKIVGVSNFNIILKHILPNAMVGISSFLPFIFNYSIVQLTALTFLGFGLPSNIPTIGDLLHQAKENLDAPWIGIPSITIMVIMLSSLIIINNKKNDIC